MSRQLNGRNAQAVRTHRSMWTCLLLSLVLAFENFFFRQLLLAAYLLFVVLFLVAGTVMALFLTLDYVIEFALGWTVSNHAQLSFLLSAIQ